MSQLSAATSVGAGLQAPVNRFSEMSTEDFINIIFTELTNQDPLQPNDTGALLDQLNSIRSIESDIKLTEKLEELVSENQLASASNMLGKVVTGLTADFQRVGGMAASVLKQGSDIVIELESGISIPIENLETVIDPSVLAGGPPAG